MFGAGSSTGVGGDDVVDTGVVVVEVVAVCVRCRVVWGGVCCVRVGGGLVAVAVLVRRGGGRGRW